MRDSVWLSIIAILMMAPRLISEYMFRFTPYGYFWVFRIIDVFDLILQTFSLIVFILYVYHKYVHGLDEKSVIIFMLLAMFLIGGQLMHFVANAIDMNYREYVHINPEENMPRTAYELMHFIDEYLSHIILFTALYGIFIFGSIIEMKKDYAVNLDVLDRALIFLFGFILGGGYGLTAVEASIPLYLLAIAVVGIVSILYLGKVEEKRLMEKPFSLFTLIIFIMMSVAILLYIYFFGFQSPRELVGEYLNKH